MPPVKIDLYRWAGKWGPFNIKISCGKCSLTRDMLKDTVEKQLHGIPVALKIKDGLSLCWEPLKNGGWHAPIVMVEDKVISQGQALNRGLLTQAVIATHARQTPVAGNHLFGKQRCPHCQRAKDYFWLGGADQLQEYMDESVKPNFERGQCSLSPSRN